MELTHLFTMQRELDSFIQQNNTESSDYFTNKVLALLVELAELANETRCFKFWSGKGPSEKEVILEEYVDSIHFLLSVGIELGFDWMNEWPKENIPGNLTELFIKTNEAIHNFFHQRSIESYKKVWVYYGAIATQLGFTTDEIMSAYHQKNEENYERQKKGY